MVVTGLIAAICIELCLAYFSARRGSILEENIVLVPEYTAGEAAKRESVPDNGGHALAGFCTGHPGRLSGV